MNDKLNIILTEYINAINKILEKKKMTQKIKITIECRACGGHGTNPDNPNLKCHTCNGTGEYIQELNIKKIRFIN